MVESFRGRQSSAGQGYERVCLGGHVSYAYQQEGTSTTRPVDDQLTSAVGRTGTYPVSPDHRPYVRLVKPVMDRFCAGLFLIVLSPVILGCCAGVRLALGPGVLLRQRRVGVLGEEFDVLKFRTMLPDRRSADVPIEHTDRRCNHKSVDDPRHTPIGRFLRKWSLDELPQLWNVVRGEMSLVGPRPELPFIVTRYEPWQHERHAVKPGMTGYWQVTTRGDGPMHLRTDVDIFYVRNVSARLDCRILLSTASAVIRHRGE